MTGVLTRSCGGKALAAAVIGVLCAVWAAPAGAAPVRFGTEGAGAGQISGEPAGVAVAQENGDVYIADRNNSRIDKFGPEGNFLLAWGWGVADGSTEAPQVCTTSCFGGFEEAPFEGAGAGQFSRAEGIAVDNDALGTSHDDVYVVDSGNDRIQKFGPEGEFILMFGGEVNATTKGDICLAGEECQAGTPGTGPGEFESLVGRSIAIDSAGTVYVGDDVGSEDRVQLFSETGAFQSEIKLPEGGFVEGLAVDSAKDIYVVSSELAGVRKYDGTGTEVGAPRDESGELEKSAITVGPADELFVNDFEQERHHIVSFDATGVQIASFDAGGRAEDGHRGIAYGESAEALYVLNEGSVRVVSPPPAGPLVLEGSELATEVQPTTVTLGATINPEGPAATTYRFEYGTTTGYGESTAEAALGGGHFEDQPVSVPVTGLQPRTTYHYRVVARNGSQTSDGPDRTFTTLPPVSIDSTSASQVNDKSARLEAELNPHGLATEYRFEYGSDSSYGKSAPIPDGSAGAGSTDVSVSVLIQVPLPSSTYHYRVVAHNSLGVTIGPDRTFETQGASSVLPDGRAWELVSPSNKHGAPLEPLTEEGGLIQAAASGGAFAYVALGPPDTDPAGVRSPHDSQLLSARGPAGWSTQDIATPHEEISKIHVSVPSEYKSFAEDLTSSLVEPEGATPLSPQTTERTPYRREANGVYVPLVTSANVLSGTKFGGEETEVTFGKSGAWTGGAEVRTATPDLSHVVLESPQLLAPGFAPGFETVGRPNLYELVGGSLQLVSVLPSGEPAAEAELSVGVGRNNLNMRGALSNDGQRVVFEAGAEEHLYMRDIGLERTLQLDERQPGAAGGSGRASFQGASSDGTKVFFTDASRLTTDATAQPGKPDLYMCKVTVAAGQLACGLSDLTVDSNANEAANVQGEVSAIDPSGTHVYFAADGALTGAANARGEVPAPADCNNAGDATCNFYEYDTSTRAVSLVATLSSHDDPDWAGRTNLHALGNLTTRTSPNGRYLAFMSERSLSGYDNRDARSGQLDAEVFLFDADSGTVRCVSCDPTGARPQGVFDKLSFPGLLVDHPASWSERWLAGSIPGWTLQSLNFALYQSRYLSNSGRMFFNAADALVPQDTNKVEDVYEFEPPGVGDCSTASSTFSLASAGCVNLISSGTSTEESAFLDATENGDEVFFLTASRLTSSDVDGAFDVYDAHVCSASSPCVASPLPPAPACDGDACQNPGSPPNDTTPGSLTYHGPESPVAQAPVAIAKPKAKPLTRAQLLARALKTCKKDKVKKKRSECEKQARKKYGAKASKAKKRSTAKKASHGSKGRNRS
jgi:hypothetical protein